MTWLLLAALASAQPPASAAEPLKGLALAVYHEQGMRGSMRFLMDYYRDEAPYLVRPDVDNAARLISAADSAASRPFGSAKNVESPEEAQRAGADLTAVLDAEAGFKRDLRLEKRARVELRAEFRDLSGRRITLLKAESVQAPFSDGRVKVRKDLYREFAAALDAAAADLEAQVRSSPELALFASVRGGAAPAGPQAGRALSSEADKAYYRLPVEPMAVALVAGVERYEDGSSAPHAERDARAVRDQLFGLGWPDRGVLWLTGRRADRSALLKALETLKRRAPAAAKTFVYFAGRSETDARTGRTALLGWDGSALPLDEVLDAASGGGAALAVIEAPAALGKPRPGLAAMAAAAPGEARRVDDSEGHGLFTLELLKSFAAAADKRGKVTARSAFDRAAARAREASGNGQSPAWSSAEGFDPVLVEGGRERR